MSRPSRFFLARLLRLLERLHPRRRWQLLGVFLLALLSSALEALSIGALMPFLSTLSGGAVGGDLVPSNLVKELPIFEGSHEIVAVTAFLVLSLLLASAAKVASIWIHARFTQVVGTEISAVIYSRVLHQPYLQHVARNSSEIVAALTSKVGTVVVGIIAPILTLLQAMVTSAAIIFTLLKVNLAVSGFVIVSFGLLYGVLIFITKERLLDYGVKISALSNEVIKMLQESLGGIRDVLIDGSQSIYLEKFRQSSHALRRVQANITIVSSSPSYVIVTLGTVLLAVIGAYYVLRDGSASTALPLLGAFALGAQRLMGNLQQAYSSWGMIRSGDQSFVDILELLEQPSERQTVDSSPPLPYSNSIELANVSFCYPGRDTNVLTDFNLRIERGQRVGIIGVTGGGKSTVLDILMGLLPPTKGELKVDGVTLSIDHQPAWRRNIAHVPQVIHLVDGSVLENIALGVPFSKVDFDQVRRAALGAQILSTIESWPSGFNTTVGERGVRLSGGQRQRIGIARALYKQASVVVFDEATSALDSETESGVIDALNAFGSDITLIMVAHRLTTLKQCNVIYEISGGKIARRGSYAELFSQSSQH